MRALIVDGSQHDCATLVDYLKANGYEAVGVTSASQARQALNSGTFDLMLLELILPDGDGLAFCNEVRELLGSGMLIFFVASEPPKVRRVAGLQIGADDVLEKPCDHDELMARVQARQRRRSGAVRP